MTQTQVGFVLITPKMLRDKANEELNPFWDGQARQTLRWAADTLEAAEAVIEERASPNLRRNACMSGSDCYNCKEVDDYFSHLLGRQSEAVRILSSIEFDGQAREAIERACKLLDLSIPDPMPLIGINL